MVATTNNPNLAVSAVKLENGTRTSKVIGATVRGDNDQEIGKVDDLIMTDGNKVTVVVVAVGGVLGLGAKLVAFPYDQLRLQGDRLVLPGVNKDNLNAMPSFQVLTDRLAAAPRSLALTSRNRERHLIRFPAARRRNGSSGGRAVWG